MTSTRRRAWIGFMTTAIATAAAALLGGCSAPADDEADGAMTEGSESALTQSGATTIDLDGVRIEINAGASDTRAGAGNLFIGVGLRMSATSPRYAHAFALTGAEDVFPYTQSLGGPPYPLPATNTWTRTFRKVERPSQGFTSSGAAGFSFPATAAPPSGEIKVQLDTATDLVRSPGSMQASRQGGPQCDVTITLALAEGGKLVAGRAAQVKASCRWPGG